MAEMNSTTGRQGDVTGFNCRICGSSFQSHIDMIKCAGSHEKETNIECEQCQSYFTNKNQLESHELLCHPKEEYDEDSD